MPHTTCNKSKNCFFLSSNRGISKMVSSYKKAFASFSQSLLSSSLPTSETKHVNFLWSFFNGGSPLVVVVRDKISCLIITSSLEVNLPHSSNHLNFLTIHTIKLGFWNRNQMHTFWRALKYSRLSK
jgi:hypothetical protein